MHTLRIATRGSELALRQAARVRERLAALGVTSELLIVKASGDAQGETPVAGTPAKRLFTKEIEDALLEGRADLGVHSLKDLTVHLPEGLVLGAIPEREDPRDALVAMAGARLATLPSGASVGTSSVRRQAAIRSVRPDLDVRPLRGNVTTRFQKVRDRVVDAAVLAFAGLKRLGMAEGIEVLDADVFVPAAGQGALAVEARVADSDLVRLLGRIDDRAARAAVNAEREVLALLDVGCNVPVGAYCRPGGRGLVLDVAVYALDGSRVIRGRRTFPPEDAERESAALAEQLLEEGAREMIAAAVRGAR